MHERRQPGRFADLAKMTSAAQRKGRVLVLVTGLARGGAEWQVYSISVGLRNRGWQISVVSMLPLEGLAGDLLAAGIPVQSLEMRPGLPNPLAVRRLARQIRRLAPDIVHSHCVHANILARVTRLICSMRALICTVHGTIEAARGADTARMREFLYRLTDPSADLTTIVSHAAAARYGRIGAVPQRKMKVIHPGIDTSHFKPDANVRSTARRDLGLSESQFAWLAAGRLEKVKDYPGMLTAFRAVHDGSPEANLLIAGEGSLEAELRCLAVRLGVARNIRFLGFYPNVNPLMNAADAYVMSSVHEGLPNVLLEAGACGLPIVTTRAGGAIEAVIPGETAWTVPVQDSQALGDAMATVMRLSPGRRTQLAAGSRRFVEEHFSREHIVSAWEDLYLQFLDRNAARSVSGQAA